MQPVHILGIGTAYPDHELPQTDARSFAQMMFGDALEDLERLLPLFENTKIQKRHVAQPLSWYGQPHSFVESNALYQQISLDISERAARQAIQRSGLQPEEIGSILFVSSTGIATPSLDAELIQRLGLSVHTARIPIWGLGCAGGVSGLARAAEQARVRPDKAVLLIATELCSLTFQQGDLSKANLVAVSLFGDGSAALVLRQQPLSERPTPRILMSHSTLFPQTEYVMGWDLAEQGLQVRFDRSIPALVLGHLASLFEDATRDWQCEPQSIEHFVVHPGGAKVLSAYAESLDIPYDKVQHAHDVLTEFGNMSSPTVFFVLERFLRDVPASNARGVMLAWGPGFSAEQLLFEW